MAVILQSERKTLKARVFLSLVYAALLLGAVTMVYPFMVMITSSFSSSYDYQRHSPIVRALFDESDRYMRFLSGFSKSFPRELYPDAPKSWTTWTRVAEDRYGVRMFFEYGVAPLGDKEFSSKIKADSVRLLRSLKNRKASELNVNYDPRDVAKFVKARYGTLENLNGAWPVPHKSFFDVSFSAESKARQYKLDENDEKVKAWNAFKYYYIDEAIKRGDYISRTLPTDPTEEEKAIIREAFAIQFLEHGWRDFFESSFANYKLVGDYLFLRGRAFVNTIILVLLSVLASLTVNPLAAYALSRFELKGTESILLFLLATMAFPAAVTAIPGFLLIRDLGLLNTFAALVLPTVASGMSIFILKGFFDALPRELYEAASIDGASEWMVFLKITLPMTTPILAVNALNSFIHAYSSWEWAFLVCQKESHWTLAVWMYQLSQTFAHQPWCVMAGFVVVSLPTAIVFLVCQKVILRGIVLPSMK